MSEGIINSQSITVCGNISFMNTSAFQVVVSAVNMLRILMNLPSWSASQSSAAHANFNCADLCHKWGQHVGWTYLSTALLCKHAKSNLAVMLLIFSDHRWSTPTCRLEASSENLLLSLRCICWGLLIDKHYSSSSIALRRAALQQQSLCDPSAHKLEAVGLCFLPKHCCHVQGAGRGCLQRHTLCELYAEVSQDSLIAHITKQNLVINPSSWRTEL